MSLHTFEAGEMVIHTGDEGAREFQRALEDAAGYYTNNNLVPEQRRINPRTAEQNVAIVNAEHPEQYTGLTYAADYIAPVNTTLDENMIRMQADIQMQHLKMDAMLAQYPNKVEEKEISNLEFLDNLK